jgi:hypothetical protein
VECAISKLDQVNPVSLIPLTLCRRSKKDMKQNAIENIKDYVRKSPKMERSIKLSKALHQGTHTS